MVLCIDRSPPPHPAVSVVLRLFCCQVCLAAARFMNTNPGIISGRGRINELLCRWITSGHLISTNGADGGRSSLVYTHLFFLYRENSRPARFVPAFIISETDPKETKRPPGNLPLINDGPLATMRRLFFISLIFLSLTIFRAMDPIIWLLPRLPTSPPPSPF